MTQPAQAAAAAPTALALHDDQPFFEKALRYGVQHGIIDAATLVAIHADAPKGMVQIARYFGSEFLRPELEKARERMVNLVSLYLQESCDSDLALAAQSLRQNSLLSHSKRGSDMLRRLIAMPNDWGSSNDNTLAQWALRSYTDYRAAFERRSHLALKMEAALWLVAPFGLNAKDLEDAGTDDFESVIRTALLWQALTPGSTEWPTEVALRKVLLARQKAPARSRAAKKAIPTPVGVVRPTLPAALRAPVAAQNAIMCADGALLLQADSTRLRFLLSLNSALRSRYFLQDDPLAEMDDCQREIFEVSDTDEAVAEESTSVPGSKIWERATQGNTDEHSLLTLFVSLAANTSKKTLLREKNALALLRKIQKSGFDPERASDFINQNAPKPWRASYLRLWEDFVRESQAALCSDHIGARQEALALLRRECHVAD